MPEEIEVKMLKRSPEVRINRISKKAYPAGWVGKIDKKLAVAWEKDKICIPTSKLKAASRPPADGDENPSNPLPTSGATKTTESTPNPGAAADAGGTAGKAAE